MIAVAGNLSAINLNTRYIDTDFNRIWFKEKIEEIKKSEIDDLESNEHREMKELMKQIDAFTFVDTPRNIVFVDPHNTSSAEGMFAFTFEGDANYDVASSLHIPIITGLDKSLQGTAIEYFANRGYCSLAFEGGPLGDPRSIDIHEAGIWMSGLAGLQIVPVAEARGINVDFGNTYGVPASSYGAASGQAGTWNKVGVGTVATQLVDLSGAVLEAHVSGIPYSNAFIPTPPTNNDQLLLNDSFGWNSNTWQLTFSGLADGTALVYIYAPSPFFAVTGSINVGGTAVASIPGDPGSTLIEGTSWVKVPVTITGGALSITGGGEQLFSGMAGLQIVRPSTYRCDYDFDSLSGLDAGTHVPLHCQDGWVTTKWNTVNDIGVTQTLGFDGSQSLHFNSSGPGVGVDASRLSNSSWSTPTLDGSETDVYFQADVRVNTWGTDFGPFNDVNGNGYTTKLEASELGPRLEIAVASGGIMRLHAADGTFTNTTLAAACNSTFGDWVRLRLVMDLTANGGSGSGDVYCMNLTNGETSWTAVAGLQGIDLKLLSGSGTARDATTWNGVFLHFEGANSNFDEFVMRKSIKRYDFDCLAGDDAGVHTPLNGQDGWLTTKFSTAIDMGVTRALAFDGSQGLRFAQSGTGVGVSASRLNDAGWALPTLTGAETSVYLQADMEVMFWGSQFAPASDVNGSGGTGANESTEIGPRLQIFTWNGGGLRLFAADLSFTHVGLGVVSNAALGETIRLRLVMDLTANGGSGSGSAFSQNLSKGDLGFTPVAGLQGIDLRLVPGSGTASDPANWEGIYLHIQGATGVLDNVEGGAECGTPPVTYCTAGTSASGCQARMSASGTSSATKPSGFFLQASDVEEAKDGLFFFGTGGRQANTWGTGSSFQCVVPPVKRAGLLTGSGTPGGCSGTFSQDLNVRWAAKPAQNPGAGAVVQAQLWYRDPFNTSNQTTSLSNAIEFVVCP